MNSVVEIYTGSFCSPNPDAGGWGAVLLYGTTQIELQGYEPYSTKNRMELTAPIATLECLKKIVSLESLEEPCSVTIYTDSDYVQKGITEWIDGWKRNGWKTKKKTNVKNRDLWEKLDKLTEQLLDLRCWARGHSGDDKYKNLSKGLAKEARLNKLDYKSTTKKIDSVESTVKIHTSSSYSDNSDERGWGVAVLLYIRKKLQGYEPRIIVRRLPLWMWSWNALKKMYSILMESL